MEHLQRTLEPIAARVYGPTAAASVEDQVCRVSAHYREGHRRSSEGGGWMGYDSRSLSGVRVGSVAGQDSVDKSEAQESHVEEIVLLVLEDEEGYHDEAVHGRIL